MKKKKFIIYPNYLPKVGGIETAVYQLAKQLDKEGHHVTIAFGTAESNESLFHYAEHADIVRLVQGVKIECDTCLIASNHQLPSQIKADKYLQWIHTDYSKYNNLQLVRNPEVTGYVAVSEYVAQVSKQMFNIDCTVIYNLIDQNFGNDDREVFRLVTASRLSPEKGFTRIRDFALGLRKMGIRFSWVIYGDNTQNPKKEEVIKNYVKDIQEIQFVGYKDDVSIGLTNADYLVQLSDFEGCPYTVLEALTMGVPCIVTDYNGADELITNGENGYIVPLDMKNIDFDSIVNKKPKELKQKPFSTVKEWEDIL